MDDSGEPRIPQHHLAELSAYFAAHDRWLFGHACVRTRSDRELAADLVQDTFEAAARAWRRCAGMPRVGNGPGCSARWRTRTSAISAASRRSAAGSPTSRPGTSPPRRTPRQALSAIALERAREIIREMPPRQQRSR
jgi:DNA-directed RNA polymerase specialized sigma24 family protein